MCRAQNVVGGVEWEEKVGWAVRSEAQQFLGCWRERLLGFAALSTNLRPCQPKENYSTYVLCLNSHKSLIRQVGQWGLRAVQT